MRMGSKWLIISGSIFIILSLCLVLYSLFSAQSSKKERETLVSQIEELIPERSQGIPDTYSSMEMPVLEIEGHDIIALLDIPTAEDSLPVGRVWDKSDLYSYPQRFSGSVYDSSLIIGGCDKKGQLDSLERLDIGHIIKVTDMTGAEFSYKVERIDRKSSAEADVLTDENFDLTLFVRDSSTMDYIIVRCSFDA